MMNKQKIAIQNFVTNSHPVSTTDTDAIFTVICRPQTLNDGGEDSVQYRNRKKHCFLAAVILLFIGKINIT